MSKYRIVIRAFTCRRDVAPMEILKRILERKGCQVILAGVRNFHIATKYWKPHAIVVNTLGDVLIKQQYPDAKVVFFSGEGFHGPNDSHAKIWLQHPEYFENMDLGLVWGPKVRDECIERLGSDKDLSKLHVVGNPKLDLVKFLPDKLRHNKKHSIGFICRFPKLNEYEGRPTIQNLVSDFHVQETIVQAKSALGMIRCANKILEETDYNISLRPHPAEQLESYEKNIQIWFKKEHLHRVFIDKSLFLPTWIAEQDIILSPTSTSFIEAYLLGVPVINIDYISDIVAFNQNYISFTKEWQEAAIMPKSIEEMIDLIKKGVTVTEDKNIERQLDEFSIKDDDNAACWNAANLMMNMLEKSDKRTPDWHVPFEIVDLWDEISFRRNMRWNKLHQNFNYRRGYHETPAYVDEIVGNIFAKAGA